MTRPILSTERLQLLPFDDKDLPLLAKLHADPEVNRYLSPGPMKMDSEEVHERFARYRDDYLSSGYSMWKLETLEGDFIGRAGIRWMPEAEGYELGYSLMRKAWGKGYASEIARGLVN